MVQAIDVMESIASNELKIINQVTLVQLR